MIEPVYDFNGVRIFEGDALTVLRTLDSASVNCCVTSPPYWGLRDYGTASWNGGNPDCDHKRLAYPAERETPGGRGGSMPMSETPYKDICGKCGATRIDSQMGLEGTPAEYVCGMVAVFEEVRRVLRDDGTLWLNLGDTYAATGGNYQNGSQGTTSTVGRTSPESCPENGRQKRVSEQRQYGIKPKDLIGIPWRVAFALQEAGWYLRSEITWCKTAPMPESVTDRPTSATEKIFLLSKSKKYYYDQDSVRVRATSTDNTVRDRESTKLNNTPGRKRMEGLTTNDYTTRNLWNYWLVSPCPFAAAHFATFPPDLIRPCILAGCPEGGTILDPFFGAGTTGLVAKQERRQAVGIELNPEYICIAERRLQQGSLFT